jgi:hypothetical protein
MVRASFRPGESQKGSTTVLLTSTVPNSNLHEIEHCPSNQDGRKLIEKMGWSDVY